MRFQNRISCIKAKNGNVTNAQGTKPSKEEVTKERLWHERQLAREIASEQRTRGEGQCRSYPGTVTLANCLDTDAASGDDDNSMASPLEMGFKDIAEALGTTSFAILLLKESAPAGAIANEIGTGGIAAVRPIPDNPLAFATKTKNAISLLRKYAEEGGRFVADQMESRADLNERWFIGIHLEGVKAYAFDNCGPAFFVTSDLLGKRTCAEVPTDE